MRWIACRYTQYFLPEKRLATYFRNQFLRLLRSAFRRGPPATIRQTGRFAGARCFRSLHGEAEAEGLGGALPQTVLRSTTRDSLSGALHAPRGDCERRLTQVAEGKVSFRWRDSAHGNRQRIMTLQAVEFMHRFLLHVLPRGFVRIRHFGFLSPRERAASFQICAHLLAIDKPALCGDASGIPRPKRRRCPWCESGTLVMIERLSAAALRARGTAWPSDTS